MKQFEVICSSSMSGDFEENRFKWFEIAKIHCKSCVMSPIHPVIDNDEYKCSHEHVHIIGKLKCDNTAETIAKWFGIQPNNVEKIKGSYNDALMYICTHSNHESHGIINPRESVSYPMDADELALTLMSIGEESEYESFRDFTFKPHWIEYVQNGTWNEYSRINDKRIDRCIIELKLKSQWDDAIRNQKTRKVAEIRRNGGSQMYVMWLYGNAGVGKTSFAKYTARKKCENFYITSCGKNPFDEYLGEKCVIIDDIGTDNGMDGKTLLKMLDINNPTFCGCRYNNKYLDCDIIIVTASVSPEYYWEQNCGGTSANGNVHQLKRRLNGGSVEVCSDGSMHIQTYDNQGNDSIKLNAKIPDEVMEYVLGKKNSNSALDFFSNGLGIDVSVDGINMQLSIEENIINE